MSSRKLKTASSQIPLEEALSIGNSTSGDVEKVFDKSSQFQRITEQLSTYEGEFNEIIDIYYSLPFRIIDSIEKLLSQIGQLSRDIRIDYNQYQFLNEILLASKFELFKEEYSWNEIQESIHNEGRLIFLPKLDDLHLKKRIYSKGFSQVFIAGLNYDINVSNDDFLPEITDLNEKQVLFLEQFSALTLKLFPNFLARGNYQWVSLFYDLYLADFKDPIQESYRGSLTTLLMMDWKWWRQPKLFSFTKLLWERKSPLEHSEVALELARRGSAHIAGERHGEEPIAKEYASVLGKSLQSILLGFMNNELVPSDQAKKQLKTLFGYAAELIKDLPGSKVPDLFKKGEPLEKELLLISRFISLCLIKKYGNDDKNASIAIRRLGMDRLYSFLNSSGILDILDLQRFFPTKEEFDIQELKQEDSPILEENLLRNHFDHLIKSIFFFVILHDIYNMESSLKVFPNHIVQEMRIPFQSSFLRADAIVFSKKVPEFEDESIFPLLQVYEKLLTKPIKIIEVKTNTGIHDGHSKKLVPKDSHTHQVHNYLKALKELYPDIIVDEIIFIYLTYRGIEVINLTPEKLESLEQKRKT